MFLDGREENEVNEIQTAYYTKSLTDNDPIENAKIHIIENDSTLCGKILSRRWFVIEDTPTCKKCLDKQKKEY